MNTATLLSTIVLLIVAGGRSRMAADEWQAPAAAAAIANPIATTPESIASGGALYRQSCLICHGAEGKGDGQGATYLVPKPASFADMAFSKENDGAVSWKIKTGRNAMPGFTMLTDTQRWQLIEYVRTLSSKSARPVKQ